MEDFPCVSWESAKEGTATIHDNEPKFAVISQKSCQSLWNLFLFD